MFICILPYQKADLPNGAVFFEHPYRLNFANSNWADKDKFMLN